MRVLRNPFFVYIITFSIIFLVYNLGWSNLYPPLSIEIILFFSITFIFSFLGGLFFNKHLNLKFISLRKPSRIGWQIIFICFCYLLEFIYNGGIPLVLIFTNPYYSYIEFGIPTFHSILLTYSSFYTVFLFQVYLSTHHKRILWYLFILLLIPLLIFNRAMLILNICSMLFLYFFYIKRASKKIILSLTLFAIIGLYLFGVAGNYRTVLKNDSSYFLSLMGATHEFKESVVPKEFMWGYIYISSPLANFQQAAKMSHSFTGDFDTFIAYSIIPDFISKRIVKIFNIKEPGDMDQINDSLNVGTIYEKPMRYLGWFGVIFMYSYMFFFILIYALLLKKSMYFNIGISILIVIITFSSFTNMFAFSGLSFQLIYPLIFTYFKFRI